jgi:hypothetical protein
MTWRSSLRTRVTVPIWSKDSPAGIRRGCGKKIPQAPINDIIRHPSKPKWLFIATDVGVYRTTNLVDQGRGRTLPLVPINDIDLPAGSETLYAATYGRSVWTTSLADIS